MHGFYTEKRDLARGVSLSQDLAQHILARGAHGAVVVATNNPHELISTTGKQWRALIRLVERERASTLNLTRISELNNQIAWMERLNFTIKLAEELSENSVTFIKRETALNSPPICSTLYIVDPINAEDFYLMTSWLQPQSVAVVYMAKRPKT
ncbi:MAG TPA: hypothetical protein VJM46_03995 [Candidatus Saccharimonadales bacterium]|nr:hypothetical protein [Candidatus Saccharimonadales bacterium]